MAKRWQPCSLWPRFSFITAFWHKSRARNGEDAWEFLWRMVWSWENPELPVQCRLLGSWVVPWFCWRDFHLLPAPSPRFLPSWQLPEVEVLEWMGCAPCQQTHHDCAGLIPVGEATRHRPVLVKAESVWLKTAPFVLCHVTSGVFLHQPLQDEKGRSR